MIKQTYEHILTFSKIKFYPLKPVKENIFIEDIAHSLSLMTRANGHFPYFYSVAQHALNCAREAKERGLDTRIQLACLLHDASESYISDITRPVKKHLHDYYVIEENLQKIIYERFNLDDLTESDLKLIRDIDDTMLYYEFYEIMDYRVFETAPVKKARIELGQKEFTVIEKEFLELFYKLVKGVSE